MFLARLICSDTNCADQLEVEARTLAELESMACGCGCGYELIGWPQWTDEAEVALVVPLPVRALWSDAA